MQVHLDNILVKLCQTICLQIWMVWYQFCSLSFRTQGHCKLGVPRLGFPWPDFFRFRDQDGALFAAEAGIQKPKPSALDAPKAPAFPEAWLVLRKTPRRKQRRKRKRWIPLTRMISWSRTAMGFCEWLVATWYLDVLGTSWYMVRLQSLAINWWLEILYIVVYGYICELALVSFRKTQNFRLSKIGHKCRLSKSQIFGSEWTWKTFFRSRHLEKYRYSGPAGTVEFAAWNPSMTQSQGGRSFGSWRQWCERARSIMERGSRHSAPRFGSKKLLSLW